MTKRQATAFALRLEGNSYAQIASLTGWSEFSLRKYFSTKGKWHSEYESWRTAAVKDVESETRIRIQKDVAHAVSVIEHALTLYKTNPSVALRAAEKILDLNGFLPYDSTARLEAISSIDQAERMAKWLETRKQ